MADLNLEKVFEIKPISDKDSKREFLKRKTQNQKLPEEKEKSEKKSCVINDGHVDCYV